MEMKKKRGNNYTLVEKKFLLELIRKHKNIIENKETTANMISKKKQTWESVCQQYNAVAATGPRTWRQLRHLYENLKQRAKKARAANRKIQNAVPGVFKRIYNEKGDEILAEVSPQVIEIKDQEDDAAVYFCDTEIKTDNSDLEMEESLLSDQQDNIGQMQRNKETYVKQEYFRIKLRNARLESKYLINKHKMEVNKYKMEMQILKLRLKMVKLSARKQNRK